MSKSLKKLIDINRLREFKNKLVGTDSAYVQTGDVDQTVDGTKAFSEPIVGSVTGSSGSCTGNSATATTATTAKACTGNAATATKLAAKRTINGTAFDGTANVTTASWGTARNISITDGTNTSTAVSVNGSANVSLKLPATIKANLTGNCSGSSGSCTGNAATATKLATARSLWGNNFDGSAAITGIITGTPSIEFKPVATTVNNGGFLDFHYNQSTADYTSRIIESASGTLSINNVTITTGKVVTATTFNGALTGNVTGNCSGSSGSCTGNAATATKLAAKRTIALSGAATGTATGFDGSGNITIPVTALAASAIRDHILSMVYPVGSVYISVNDVSPEKFLGGKWVKISQGRVLQGASGTQTAGTEVSAGLPNISVSSNGAHTHTRGSMNITGSVTMHGAGGCTVIAGSGGAFYGSGINSTYHTADCYGGASSADIINFSADRTWTGSTSSAGAHSHDVYITGITGNSTTVQPPALLVNIWKRTA